MTWHAYPEEDKRLLYISWHTRCNFPYNKRRNGQMNLRAAKGRFGGRIKRSTWFNGASSCNCSQEKDLNISLKIIVLAEDKTGLQNCKSITIIPIHFLLSFPAGKLFCHPHTEIMDYQLERLATQIPSSSWMSVSSFLWACKPKRGICSSSATC